jgi:hypothetical protein
MVTKRLRSITENIDTNKGILGDSSLPTSRPAINIAVVIIMFRKAARRLASLPPTMPLIALRVVMQQMAAGGRSANLFAAQRLLSIGTYL